MTSPHPSGEESKGPEGPQPNIATSDLRSFATKDFNYPCCKTCHKGWAWPRNLRLVNVHSDAHCPNPRTKNTIVPYLSRTGLPPELIQQVHFVCRRDLNRQRLVRSFEYSTNNGRVFYDPPTEAFKHNSAYARLITLNSWWQDLASHFGRSALLFGGLISDLLFILFLLEGVYRELPEHCIIFTLVWSLMVFVWLSVAHGEATKEWRIRAHPNIGDISVLPGATDEWFTFMALVLFIFLGLDCMVRDIVIYLHPWKGVQPYAAFKSQGTRAFLVGFPDKSHFLMESWASQYLILPLRLATVAWSFGYKVFVLFFDTIDDVVAFYFLLATTLTSLCSMLMALWTWRKLRVARSRWWEKKTKVSNTKEVVGDFEYRHFNDDCCACGIAICTVLAAPFIALSKLARTRSDPPVETDTCVCCGRSPEKPELTAKRLKGAPQEVGSFVVLSDDYKSYSDAKHGVLGAGDVGHVLKNGEFVEGYGRRVLVQRLHFEQDCAEAPEPFEGIKRSWWYDSCALRKASPEEAFIAQEMTHDPLKRVRELSSQMKSIGQRIDEELLNMDATSVQRALGVVESTFHETVDMCLVKHGSNLYLEDSLAKLNSFQIPKSSEKAGPCRASPSCEKAVPRRSRQLDPPPLQVCGHNSSLSNDVGPRFRAMTTDSEARVLVDLPDSPDLTPREAALREVLESAHEFKEKDHMVAFLPRTVSGTNFVCVRSKALVSEGRVRVGVSVLGGLTVNMPDTNEMLGFLGQFIGCHELLSDTAVLVTASYQGVEQKLADAWTKESCIANLVVSSISVPSKRGVDIVAGQSYAELRHARCMVADICVVVEGGPETAEDAKLAFQRGAKVIPVGKYGGAAAGELSDVPDEMLRRPSWADPGDWDELTSESNARRTAMAITNLIQQAVCDV